MSSVPDHMLGCKCTQCMHAQCPVSADLTGSLSGSHPHRESSNDPTNDLKTTHQTLGDRELIKTPSGAHVPSLLRYEVKAEKAYSPQSSVDTVHHTAGDRFKPAMLRISWVVEEITSDDSDSACWSDAESDKNGKLPANGTAPEVPYTPKVEVKPDVELIASALPKNDMDGNAPASDTAPIVPPKSVQMEVTKSLTGKTPAVKGAGKTACMTRKLLAKRDNAFSSPETKDFAIVTGNAPSTDTALVANTKTLKVAAKPNKVDSAPKLKIVGGLPGKAPVSITATNTASEIPGGEVKRYNILTDSELQDGIEAAMRATFPAELVDPMMADLKGDTALKHRTADVKMIEQMLDGIDKSHQKIGVASLAELYPKRLSKPEAAAEVETPAMTLKERLAVLNEKDERLKKRKEERLKKQAAKKEAVKEQATKKEAMIVEKVKNDPVKVDQRGAKDDSTEDATKILAQAGVVLENPTDKCKTPKKPQQDVELPYVEMSPKSHKPFTDDNKENVDPKAKLE